MVVVPFHSAAFYSQLKSKVGNILTKGTDLLINLNIDDAPIVTSHTHTLTPPTHKPLVASLPTPLFLYFP